VADMTELEDYLEAIDFTLMRIAEALEKIVKVLENGERRRT